MSLNLGQITDESSSMSAEELLLQAADAEIELTEMLHSMENLENARKIQDLAKQSGSMECMHFAEELLGCSMEVDLSGIDKPGNYAKTHALISQCVNKISTIAPQILEAVQKNEKIISWFQYRYGETFRTLEKRFDEIVEKYCKDYDLGNVKMHHLVPDNIYDITKYAKLIERASRIALTTGKMDKEIAKNPKIAIMLKEMIALVRSTLAIFTRLLRDIKKLVKRNML